jgi:hypothetical protein
MVDDVVHKVSPGSERLRAKGWRLGLRFHPNGATTVALGPPRARDWLPAARLLSTQPAGCMWLARLSCLTLPFTLPPPHRPPKVFIEVNEKGTEAAAATAVLMMRTAMPLAPPAELRLDRPFVFGVQHAPSGAMLFLGVVERPEAWNE